MRALTFVDDFRVLPCLCPALADPEEPVRLQAFKVKKEKNHSTAISEFNQFLLMAGYQRLPGQARAGFQEPRLERGDGGGGERVGGEGGGSGGFVVGGGYDN